MKVFDTRLKQLIFVCVGLIVAVVCFVLDPGLVVGVLVGFGVGCFCMKRWPERFRIFSLPVNKDKARIKELEKENNELKLKVGGK
jgi:hypothetical protein